MKGLCPHVTHKKEKEIKYEEHKMESISYRSSRSCSSYFDDCIWSAKYKESRNEAMLQIMQETVEGRGTKRRKEMLKAEMMGIDKVVGQIRKMRRENEGRNTM